MMPVSDRFERSDDATARFWTWWDGVRAPLTQALRDGAAGEFTEALQERITDLHPSLQWDLRRGTTAAFALCVSGSGDAIRRLIVERWRRAGPDDDSEWQFHTTRPASRSPGSLVVNIAGEAVALSELLVVPDHDASRERLNCTVYHPAFRSLPTVTRKSLAVLLLDHAVGEEGVETWLGAIDTAIDEPEAGVDVHGLRDLVEHREQTATGLHWGITTQPGEDGTLFQIVNYAVKRWAFPTYDARCDITFRLERPTPAGIPDPWESDAFEGIEDGLSRALEGHAVLVARTSGRQRHTVHLYAAHDGIAPQAIAAWARRVSRAAQVDWVFDPEWSLLTRTPAEAMR